MPRSATPRRGVGNFGFPIQSPEAKLNCTLALMPPRGARRSIARYTTTQPCEALSPCRLSSYPEGVEQEEAR